ncbi:FAD-dependent oxidoreductase [Streptomyces sp. NPDC127036]|uniref:FAD-dependent oxidoreductase n=1 Tax=Streptomyces sp. NPDC127036 TaxID=3347112 RepID=UPI0036517B3B
MTLVGDAAHLMWPFAGERANLAMYDGADLASKLVERLDIEAALTAYEERLILRSCEAASRSAQNLEIFFGREAPQSVVTLFDPLDLRLQSRPAGPHPHRPAQRGCRDLLGPRRDAARHVAGRGRIR